MVGCPFHSRVHRGGGGASTSRQIGTATTGAGGDAAGRLATSALTPSPTTRRSVTTSSGGNRSGASDAATRKSSGNSSSSSRNATSVHAVTPAPLAVPPPATHLNASSLAALAALSAPSGGDAAIGADLTSRYTRERRSSVVAIGLSCHTAPVAMRERLAVPEDKWPAAVRQLASYPHIEEAGILSTCNRLELYAVAYSWHRGVREMEAWLAETAGVPLEELRPYLFLLRDRDAVRHLLKVSGGLDSLVLGEGQILAQVKNVARLGENHDAFGRQLTGLFQQAIVAGKRVRTETGIASGAVSVSSAAAELAAIKLPGGGNAEAEGGGGANCFDGVRVLIIGAGKMARLLVKHLVAKGCTSMTVVNRSAGRVEELMRDFPEANIVPALLPDMMRAVSESDVIFTAASSETPILTAADVASMPEASDAAGGVRRFFDIAVPRNVAADVEDVAGAACFNVDDLREVVEANKDARDRAAQDAKQILEDERCNFESWRDSLQTVPTIKKLRSKAESIRVGELDKASAKIGDLSPKQRKVLEEMSRSIVNKLLHGPMQALRTSGTDSSEVNTTLDNMYALERMFDLQKEVSGPAAKAIAAAAAKRKGGSKGGGNGM